METQAIVALHNFLYFNTSRLLLDRIVELFLFTHSTVFNSEFSQTRCLIKAREQSLL